MQGLMAGLLFTNALGNERRIAETGKRHRTPSRKTRRGAAPTSRLVDDSLAAPRRYTDSVGVRASNRFT